MSIDNSIPPVQSAGVFEIGGDLPVRRLGYGAMRITGPGIWGHPADPDAAIALLRRAVELGVDFIDTADSYGPFVSEDLIREALHPYDDLVIATKGGLTRSGPDKWAPVGSPYYLRQCVEMSLRRLGVECIDLYQLHRIDANVPLEDQLGALKDLQDQGKIRHLGLSQVSVQELEAATELIDVSTVQNLYNLGDRSSEGVLGACEEAGIGFIPWFPVAAGPLARPDGPLTEIVARTGIPAAQLSLAWLLRRSPVIVPIPGTSSIEHLEQNCAAAQVVLDDATFAELSAIGQGAGN